MGIPLPLDIAFVLVAGFLYAYVGWRISRRRVGGDAQLAIDAFSAWWFSLAAITVQGAAAAGLYATGVHDLATYLTLTHFVLLLLCAAFWGLNYYLVFLFTGSRRWLLPSIAYWLVLYLGVVYIVTARHPDGVVSSGSSVSLHYATEANPILGTVFVVAFVVPIIIGAVGYARLYFRVEDPTQRYRIGLVSASIVAWFSSSLLASVLQISTAEWWEAISRLIGLAASFIILLAYQPPAWVRRRYGIRAIDDPTG